MSDLRIEDLTNPVTAAKADWLPGTTWIGFTPSSSEPHAASQCEATICRQMKDGYVIEYITHSIDHPNGGFESDPEYLDVANEHPKLAGRLIAVHRLRPTMRPLREVLGDKEFEHLQDMWAQEGKAPSLVGHVSHHRELRNPGEAAGNGGPEFGRLQAAVPALVQHTSAGK